MTDPIIETWRDLSFTVRATAHEYRVEFELFALDGFGVDASGEAVIPLWHKQGSPSFPDPVESLAEAERYLHGDVKWDGCSNWAFDEQERAMLHACGREDLTRLGEAMARCWDWTAKLLPAWDKSL